MPFHYFSSLQVGKGGSYMLVTQEVSLNFRQFYKLIHTDVSMDPDLIVPLHRGYLLPRYHALDTRSFHVSQTLL